MRYPIIALLLLKYHKKASVAILFNMYNINKLLYYFLIGG
jgi:hypothetical protein